MELMGLSIVEQVQPRIISWVNTWVDLQKNYDLDARAHVRKDVKINGALEKY